MPLASELILLPIAAAAAGAIVAQGLFRPRSRLFCPVVCHAGPAAGPRVALTFDDGPWPGATDRILDILARRGQRATFFVIGRYGAAHRSLLRRIHDEGHLLGNHTYDHSRLGLFGTARYWREQIQRTDDVVADVTGERPRLFRPPMGFKSPPLARAAAQRGHTVVAWSRRGGDGVTTTPDRIARSLSGARGGDIILLHDGRDPASRRDPGETVAALPRVLDALQDRGLACVRLDAFSVPGLRPAPAASPDGPTA